VKKLFIESNYSRRHRVLQAPGKSKSRAISARNLAEIKNLDEEISKNVTAQFTNTTKNSTKICSVFFVFLDIFH